MKYKFVDPSSRQVITWEDYLVRAVVEIGGRRFGDKRADLRIDLIKNMQIHGVELLLIIFWIFNR